MHHATKVIEKCISDAAPGEKPLIAHLGCFHKATIASLKAHKIPLTVRDLKVLNDEILTMRHIVNPDETDYASLHELFSAARDLAAAIGFVMDLTKDKIKIDNIRDYDEKTKAEKKIKAEQSIRTAESDQEKIERSAKLAAERENPALRDKRKAIEGFIKGFGLSLDAATAMVEESMRKAGKDPATGAPIQ